MPKRRDKKYNPYRQPPIRPVPKVEGYDREIVPRSVWGARPAAQHPPMTATSLPVENVIFTYYTQTDACDSEESCQRIMREMQELHIARGLPDIAYNFVIGGDLKIYEGRGWDLRPELNEVFPTFHDNSIEIAFIGDHRGLSLENPMNKLIIEAFHAIDIGTRLKNVMEPFRLKETTPKLRIETMGDDERSWKPVRKCDVTIEDPIDKADNNY